MSPPCWTAAGVMSSAPAPGLPEPDPPDAASATPPAARPAARTPPATKAVMRRRGSDTRTSRGRGALRAPRYEPDRRAGEESAGTSSAPPGDGDQLRTCAGRALEPRERHERRRERGAERSPSRRALGVEPRRE